HVTGVQTCALPIYMEVPRGRKAERLLQVPLSRHAFEQIAASNDRRDALLGVIDDDREVVSRQPVAPPDHVIAIAEPRRRDDSTLEPVLERRPVALDAHPHGEVVAREAERAARAGIAR